LLVVCIVLPDGMDRPEDAAVGRRRGELAACVHAFL
jgi:hypothetical protein